MSWECRFLRETFCDKRKRECHPGSAGCVLAGKFAFPFDEFPEIKSQEMDFPKDRESK